MTREEEIYKAANDYSYDITEGRLYHDLECGFRKGAEWADKNPVNPWHKVSEELPKEGAFLVCKMGKQPIYKTLEYSSERDGFWTSSGGFITRYGVREYFTHWMPIPELPKEC